MKFVNYKIGATKEEVMTSLRDNGIIADDEAFRTKKGRANMTVREKGNSIKIKCRMIDGPSKDNAFLEGTTFWGSVKERDGVTCVKGIILTAPIFHSVLISLMVLLIIQCIRLGGINPVPIILFIFSIFIYKDEYKKQGMIKGFIYKALRATFMKKHPEMNRGR